MPRLRIRLLKILHIAPIFGALLFAGHCSSASTRDDARFSYENLYQDRYTRGNGGIIPVTLERGESYSGTISKDQKYLYFSSNTSGNYDIYLRDLGDVFSVPVVSTVTNQREPAISPDGKYLVYVDDELDPDGDIILLKVNPKKLIELYRDRAQPGDEWFASRAKNLTNSENNRIRARDANPSWSPDGKFIAWSSDLVPQKADDLGPGAGAMQNIWIMPAGNPEEKRQLTTQGGVMPSFSEDGTKIVYVSYQDKNSLGAVYEIEIASGKSRKITSGHALDFYPTYAPAGGIVLTRISADTNGDGQIDRKDAGQIIRVYADEDQVVDDDDYVPLTSPSDHVFDSRVSNFIGGSVVHAQLKGEDINVAFIPLSGAIPIKPDIRQQQEYLQTLSKKKNQARYCMGLQQLPAAFRNSADLVVYDAVSALRRGRCDKTAGRELQEYLTDVGPGELGIYRLLNDIGLINPEYADLRHVVTLEPMAEINNANQYFADLLADKDYWQHLEDEYEVADFTAVQTFVRHELAKLQIRQGRRKEMLDTVKRIMRDNPSYLALDEILLEAGIADSSSLPAVELIYLIAEKADAELLRGYAVGGKTAIVPVRPHIRRRAEKFLLSFFDRQYEVTNEDAQEQFLAGFPEARHRTLHAIYALATARDDENEELYPEAIAAAERAKALSVPGSLLHFLAASVAAEAAEVTVGAEASVAQFSAAISGYRDSEAPENVKEVITKLAQFYSERASIARNNGNDTVAAQEYQSLLDLYLSAHANKLKSEIPAGDLLDYSLNLDQIALRAAVTNGDLLNSIMQFYDNRIDLARRFLVSEFIFGRGFLRAQLGIQRHLYAEADGLTNTEKKQVFEDFRKAEIDLNWCFFANSRFADAYIMLGWMYQFIDEKREVVLEKSTGKKDREIFESLYRTYFPDYLFEKNIRIYQKTLALFGQSGSPRIRNSFHLNIANNYFLLNNYSQAEEHYASILDAKGNPDFRFETPEQQMMFYYHFGRSLYFSGKNDVAARYLQFVEKNLDARYPINGVNAEQQKINQGRREIAYKTFALNAEYSQNVPAAIAYLRIILSERQMVAAETPVAMIHLELARLQLKQGDFATSLEDTLKAETALEKEPNVAIPKFKLRIKWFWVYEPWSFLVGLIYKLSYDDVYIGDNHLAFDLPTVNRYQLLYSIRAEIYRNKGLLPEASESLGRLVEYAEKDSTKHGAETLSAAVSRRAELEFMLKNWDAARELYAKALKSAEKTGNSGAILPLRKNIQLCKLRKLEADNQPIAEKIETAGREAGQVREYVQKILDQHFEAAREQIKKNGDPAKTDLSDEDRKRITAKVRSEQQPLLFFEGLNRAHEAELSDFRGRFEAREETFDQFMQRKQQDFSRFAGALKYFRGYTRETLGEVDTVFEPDVKNNGLRLKLAMNRAKILQEMDLFEESIAELREIQEKSQEFRAQLEYVVATYRMHRVYEDAELEKQIGVSAYENLIAYFTSNPGFLRENTDLFERICNIVIERSIRAGNFLQAIKLEDLKRQQLGLQMYFDDLVLFGEKEAQFGQLLIAEQKRRVLDLRIRNGRLARQSVQTYEKELLDLEAVIVALRRKLREPDRLDYRYDTFFAPGITEAELAKISRAGVAYVLKPGDQTYVIYLSPIPTRKGIEWRFDKFFPTNEAVVQKEMMNWLKKKKPAILVVSPRILAQVLSDADFLSFSLQTSLRAAINFSNNPDQAKRNLLQLSKGGSLLSFSTGNEVDYNASQPLVRLRTQPDVAKLPMHRNVVDYEGDLARKSILIDNAQLTPATLFKLRSNPNFVVASRQSREKLQTADDFRYALSVDLFFSAMGAGQVYHTFSPRRQAKQAIETYLNEGMPSAGGMMTGNAVISTGKARELPPVSAKVQRGTYTRKIDVAREAGLIDEAASYAEDAVSLFPGDSYFHYQAGSLHLMQGQRQEAQPHMDAVSIAAKEDTERREPYVRMLLRAGEYSQLESLLNDYPDLRKAIAKKRTEYDALMQLRSLGDGNLNLLNTLFPWDTEKQKDHTDLLKGIHKKMGNVLLRNEICNAAVRALEYRVVASSCASDARIDRAAQNERLRIGRWVSGQLVAVRTAENARQMFADHAVALLEGGFISDGLVYSQRVLSHAETGTTENLLALSLLRILALRKCTLADCKKIADQLFAYGSAASPKVVNSQAKEFYLLLASTQAVWTQGGAALPAAPQNTVESSGVITARNLLHRLALSVHAPQVLAAGITNSGLATNVGLERELAVHLRSVAAGGETAHCPPAQCNLLIKHYLTAGAPKTALQLFFESQGLQTDFSQKQNASVALFGYAELFPAEIYRWRFDGRRAYFESLPEAVLRNDAAAPAASRYLLFNARGGPLQQRKLYPGRDAILVTAVNPAMAPALTLAPEAISFGSPNNDTLYASFVAKWGNAQKTGKASVVVKPAFHKAGGALQIYADAISLDSLPKIKTTGYHLFCDPSESYAGFATFAHTLVEKMAIQKMSVEEAYFASFEHLKGKQASTRPLYYLYRN